MAMFDTTMLLLVALVFALAGGYARMCDRLLAQPSDKFYRNFQP